MGTEVKKSNTMEFDLSNFTTIERGQRFNPALENCVRIKSTGLAVSSDIMKRYERSPEDEQVQIVFQYSEEYKALRLSAPSVPGEGFSLNRRKTTFKSGQTGFSNLPSSFKKLGVPKGSYEAAGEQYPDIYVLKSTGDDATSDEEDLAEKYFIEEPATIGDVVCWITDATHGRVIATGVVGAIYDKDLPSGEMEAWATIKPYSKVWKDSQTKETTNVKLSKVIVREKANV